MTMNETTISAVKGWAHVNYMYVFETVLHFGMDPERVTRADKWTMSALVDNEGIAPDKARVIMHKVQTAAIRKAVKRLDEIGHGTFDEELKVWRGF